MTVAQDKNLEEPVYKLFVQQRSSGLNVHGVQLCSAVNMLVKHMKINFKASDGIGISVTAMA